MTRRNSKKISKRGTGWLGDEWNRGGVRLASWLTLALLLTLSRLGEASYGLQGDLPLHYHLTRSMSRALAEGEWLPTWAGLLEGGRGSAFFTFYPPLFYWIGGVMGGLGVPLLTVLKLMTVGILVFNQWAAWQLARIFLGRSTSLVVSGLAVLLPGLGLIGLNRGFLPQALAAGFVPLALAGAERIRRGERGEIWLLSGLAGVVLTHAITAWMTMVAIGIFIVGGRVWRDERNWRRLLGTGLVAAGLTAFFWLPQLMEMAEVQVEGQVVHQDYRHYLLFAPPAGDSAYREAWHGLNEVAGVVILIQSGLALVAGLLLLGWAREATGMVRFGIGTTLFGLLIALPQSELLWRVVPGLRFIQFPWRWQPLTALVAGLLTGLFIERFASLPPWRRLTGGALLVLLLAGGMVLTFQLTRSYSREGESGNLARLTGTGPAIALENGKALALQERGDPEYLRYTANQVYFRPRGAETPLYQAVDRPGSLEIVQGAGRIEERRLGVAHRHFQVEMAAAGRVRLITYAYRHWRVRLNGQPAVIEPTVEGLMALTLPSGVHQLEFDYQPPRYPFYLSLLTLVGVAIAGTWRRRGER